MELVVIPRNSDVEASAVRNEPGRRLLALLDELEEELGPADKTEVTKYSELFAALAATRKQHEAKPS